ncbi:cation diffusion facilitator family transporter [Bordetella genomosp. 11]|uniref:Cation transporter n=1 Tax=Bordetella genomosp. 11 TaxID=1416808 RepID=A0A261ULF1_9BORD|nr:cation diffusion facilitator family transporter [Bordetella genomosp. 11]OZI62709.1 cation transporter [Bordetella genomosp. 11]
MPHRHDAEEHHRPHAGPAHGVGGHEVHGDGQGASGHAPAGERKPGHGHAAHGHAGHDHGVGTADERRLAWALAIIVLFMIVEVAGGLVSGSLALLADAGHMVSDAAALGFSLVALRFGRRSATQHMSYGYRRLEILAAFVNGLALFAIAAWIMGEAIQRFWQPVDVMAGTMLAIAIAGLAANIVAFFVLTGGSRSNLNTRSALLHVLGDMLGSVAAIVAAVVIMLTAWTPIDPILSIFVALIVLKSAWHLVRSTGHILLEGTPPGLEPGAIKADLEQNVAVVRVAHHIHAWSITSEQHLLTLHVVPREGVAAGDVIRAVRQRVAERFGISHVTVQVEDPDHGNGDAAAIDDCNGAAPGQGCS